MAISGFLNVDKCLHELFVSGCGVRGYGYTSRVFGYRGFWNYLEKLRKVCKSLAKVCKSCLLIWKSWG